MVDLVSFSALTAAGKAIGSAVKLKDKGEILDVIIPLQENLNEAQRQATEALSHIHNLTMKNIELEKKLLEMEKAGDWKSKYELCTFPTGPHVWKLKAGESEDYNFICPPCSEKGQKSGLQKTGITLTCPACKFRVYTESRNVTPPRVIC